MLDSMVQIQLRMRAMQGEEQRERATGEGGIPDRGGSGMYGTDRTHQTESETFLQRMERIRKREELAAARLKKKERRRRYEELYEAQLALRRARQKKLDRQFICKKQAEREASEKRGEMLALARAAGGRLPVSAEVKSRA